MAVSELSQLVIILYEYLYNKGNRIEKSYNDLLDFHFRDMFSSRPELRLDNYDMLRLVEAHAQFSQFCEIQKEIYDILALYKKAAFGDPAESSPLT